MSFAHSMATGWMEPGIGTTMVVDEISDTGRGYASGPERALMSALLFDGVQSYMSYVCARSEGLRAKYREAYNWVTGKENEYIFSFENVCGGLGLDPDYLRVGLVNACNSSSDSWKRSRRNF